MAVETHLLLREAAILLREAAILFRKAAVFFRGAPIFNRLQLPVTILQYSHPNLLFHKSLNDPRVREDTLDIPTLKLKAFGNRAALNCDFFFPFNKI